ncbi:unnamed protein product [Alopecurus aequalis]
MLRLQSYILTRLLSSPATSPVSPLHRLLSAAAAGAAPADSLTPAFSVERYLVDTCGLTKAQALKASTKLSHLKSPTKPDAVLGLSGAEVAALVARAPLFLLTGVDRVLRRNVVRLTDLGLSPSEIARLASLAPFSFRRSSIVSNLPYYHSLFGSYENLLRELKQTPGLLACSLDKAVKPNVAFLHECGLEALGVPRGSGMFRLALQAVAFLSEEKIAVKVGYLKSTFMWSAAEVGIAVSKFPMLLAMSNEILHRKSEFLISEVGLESAYIAHRPVMLGLRLEGRLRSRYYVLKFLKENGLQDRDRDYYPVVKLTEKEFLDKFICPHKEAAPHLAQDYEAASRGEVPTTFRFP